MHKPTRNNSNSAQSRFLPLTSGIDYELIDCGNGRKLERYGNVIVDRPESNVDWPAKLGRKEWEKAHWHFYEERGKKGTWTNRKNAPEQWKVNYQYQTTNLSFQLKITAFKHLGIFQEQAENWKFIQRQITKLSGEVKVLNLFAYTGAASLVAAASGAEVTNVDSVKQVLNWGRENAASNKIDNIRWILEDARKFVKKAVRRGDKFQGIILDPPAFGLGTKGEKWKIENDLNTLLTDVIQLLHPKRHFFVLNTYSPKLPMHSLQGKLKKIEGFPAQYEALTLGLRSNQNQNISLGNLIRFTK